MDIDWSQIWGDPGLAALDTDQRRRVIRLLRVIEAHPSERRGITTPGGLLDRIAAECPCKRKNAERMWLAWRSSRDWRALYDQRSTPRAALTETARLRELLAEKIQKLAELHTRSISRAIIDLRELIKKGELPGFEAWAGMDALPPGCSETALRNHIRKIERDRKRYGLKASAAHAASVLTTRAQLRPGQIYEFDDVEHDTRVLVGAQAVRVVEFAAQDVASGYVMHHGGCAAVKRGEGVEATPGKAGSRQKLNQKMALMFIAYVLRYVGYDRDGVELHLEHATTSLPSYVIELLQHCGENIRIVCGGINGWQQKYLGGYEGTPGGNPHNKPRKEQQWSSMHNLLDDLPGQVGKDRQHCPEELAGQLKVQSETSRFELALRERGLDGLADCLCNTLLNFNQFNALLNMKYKIYNESRDHKREGFGMRQIPLYNGGGYWRTEGEITEGRGFDAADREFYAAHPHLVKMVNMSPVEVWKGAGKKPKDGWRRLPLSVYVEMLGEEKNFGRRVTVRGQRLAVQDKYLSQDALIYRAELHTPEGAKTPLTEGREYRVVINPVADAPLVVLDDKGKILGECPQCNKYSPLDKEMLHEQMGRIRAENVSAQTAQRLRWAHETNLVSERREYNRQLAALGGVNAGGRQPAALAPARPKAAAVRGGLDVFEGLGELPGGAPEPPAAALPDNPDTGFSLDDLL